MSVCLSTSTHEMQQKINVCFLPNLSDSFWQRIYVFISTASATPGGAWASIKTDPLLSPTSLSVSCSRKAGRLNIPASFSWSFSFLFSWKSTSPFVKGNISKSSISAGFCTCINQTDVIVSGLGYLQWLVRLATTAELLDTFPLDDFGRKMKQFSGLPQVASASCPSPWHACLALALEVTTVLLPEGLSLASGSWDSSTGDNCFLDISCSTGNSSPSDTWLSLLEQLPELESSLASDVLLGLPSLVPPSSSPILSFCVDWVRSNVATGEWLETFSSDGWAVVALLVFTFSWESALRIICLSQFFLLSNTERKLRLYEEDKSVKDGSS